MARADVASPDTTLGALGQRPDFADLPAWLERANAGTFLVGVADLDPFARILATTDGTVTEILEAWANDRVAVGRISQREESLVAPLSVLDASARGLVLRREVLLVGAQTRRPLLHAESMILVERLPATIHEGLRQGWTPIGRLLRTHRLETYREFLHLGRGAAGPLAAQFHIAPTENLIERIYRIFAGGRPVMLIQEEFPERMTDHRLA